MLFLKKTLIFFIFSMTNLKTTVQCTGLNSTKLNQNECHTATGFLPDSINEVPAANRQPHLNYRHHIWRSQWRKLPIIQRKHLIKKWRKFRKLPPAQREKIFTRWRKFRHLPPELQNSIREKFHQRMKKLTRKNKKIK